MFYKSVLWGVTPQACVRAYAWLVPRQIYARTYSIISIQMPISPATRIVLFSQAATLPHCQPRECVAIVSDESTPVIEGPPHPAPTAWQLGRPSTGSPAHSDSCSRPARNARLPRKIRMFWSRPLVAGPMAPTALGEFASRIVM